MNIHYISPYRTDKNIGLAINQAIEQSSPPGTDWIVHCDQDITWLLPDSKSQLERILCNTEYDVLGPVTNRLSQQQQLVKGMFNVYDIRVHIACAKEAQLRYGDIIDPTTDILAAFCLCFRVSVWRELGGFVPNCLQFDSLFCGFAVAKGYKLGIMPGIYLLHLYRMMSDNPTSDITHLLPVPDQE